MRTSSLWPLATLLQICTLWCTKLRKNFNAIMEVFYCFTVAIGLPGDASDYCRTKKDRQLQRACKQRWLSSEATVRATVEVRFWLFGRHWSSCWKVKMMQCALFHWDLKKQKFSNWFFPSVNTATSPDRTEQSFSSGMFWLCTDESFLRTVHQ